MEQRRQHSGRPRLPPSVTFADQQHADTLVVVHQLQHVLVHGRYLNRVAGQATYRTQQLTQSSQSFSLEPILKHPLSHLIAAWTATCPSAMCSQTQYALACCVASLPVGRLYPGLGVYPQLQSTLACLYDTPTLKFETMPILGQSCFPPSHSVRMSILGQIWHSGRQPS